MNITAIITAVVVVAGLGLLLGLFLGAAGIWFKVEVDEKEEQVLASLPGNNCGGCGYPGCSGLAAAIAKGEAPVNACPVGGEKVGKVIAEIMGVRRLPLTMNTQVWKTVPWYSLSRMGAPSHAATAVWDLAPA